MDSVTRLVDEDNRIALWATILGLALVITVVYGAWIGFWLLIAYLVIGLAVCLRLYALYRRYVHASFRDRVFFSCLKDGLWWGPEMLLHGFHEMWNGLTYSEGTGISEADDSDDGGDDNQGGWQPERGLVPGLDAEWKPSLGHFERDENGRIQYLHNA